MGDLVENTPAFGVANVLTVQNVAVAFEVEAEALRCQDGTGVLASMRPLRLASSKQ